jgi:CRP/FNR family transcriptional regulator, anaerobic regulatory protein
MAVVTCKPVTDELLPERCRDCPSRLNGFCASLSPAELARLHPHLIRKRMPAGETIMSQGVDNAHYYHVVSGTAKLSAVLENGMEQILGLRFTGDFLGQRFASETGFAAEAATDIELCKVPRSALDALADANTHIGHLMHRQVAAELDETRAWVLTIARRDARQRVAGLLHRIARRQPSEATRTHFALPLSRAEIGNYLGLTVETISRQLTALRRDGLIAIERKTHVTVMNMMQLAAAAGISG